MDDLRLKVIAAIHGHVKEISDRLVKVQALLRVLDEKTQAEEKEAGWKRQKEGKG